MAQHDIEVEIKIPVTKPIFERLRKQLRKEANFINGSLEIDKYFNAPHRDFLRLKHPLEYLRIRFRKNSGVIAYKHVYFGKDGRKTHSDEYETKVEKPEQLEKILNILNFKNFLTIEKQREKYLYQNKFEVELDKVKELGCFVEMEAAKNFGGLKATQGQLLKFAKELGLDPSQRDEDGYVLLLMKKKGLAKN